MVGQQLQFQSWLYTLMMGCMYFLGRPFNILGFQISLLNVMVVTEVFYLVMHFIGKMFGKTEVDD